MHEIIISKEQARQFALSIFDVFIQDIKAQEAKEQEVTGQQGGVEGRAAI